MRHLHHAGCGCLGALSRRNLLGLGLGAAALAATGPALADERYEAMLMNCIDPRFTTDTWKYMDSRGWRNKYSQMSIAGGPIAAVAPIFQEWRADCGAATLAFGNRIKTDKAFETEMLGQSLHAFRTQALKRQPQLIVELGIMDLNGNVETVSA